MAEYVPDYQGTVTKYVFVESPLLTPKDLAVKAYEISAGVMIKETCFGLQVTGTPEEVEPLIRAIREFDPTHIFIKDRGFPPGDERRCRANLGGARPGYLGHEFEMQRVRYISHGLSRLAGMDDTEMHTAAARRPEDERARPLDLRRLKKLIEAEEP
ncbi:putative methanogenesis marker protein 6 [Methanofollis sp. W23]|uniref:methanogenesis marker 6 protein n=1 Tax=Methanofollis sp. W23 TaxID=2817849 RepID=UPI001AE6DCF5|nr:methanogenesis marker 6 protein [Methanofollis sp. W23]MBP2146601.1 putative methanogenesis marker protein 6 [Methanofollis sp. W23]